MSDARVGKWWQRPAYKAQRRLRMIRLLYGLTPEGYTALLQEQNALCAICRSAPNGRFKELAVDHDHRTGEVRGLLCHRCNRALGLLDDDAERALRVAQYLTRQKEKAA